MNALTLLQLAGMFGIGFYASVSDFRTERIPNKALAMAFALAVILDAAQLGFAVPELRIQFAQNILAACVLSLVLFYSHTWAGGDCKLACVLALLYPPNLYMSFGEMALTLPLAAAFAFILGSLYLLFDSAVLLLREKPTLQPDAIASQFLSFLQSYACGLALIGSLHLLNELFVRPYYAIDPIVVTGAAFCCIWLLASRGLMKNKALLVVLLALDIGLSFLGSSEPLGLNPIRCLFVLAVVLLRIVVTQQNYRNIPTSEVVEGMVLSTASSLMFMNSRVKGLPGVSTEDLRSRLTAEEAESVRRWGKSAKGLDTVQVVRKLPFAVFVSLGFAVYLLFRGIA